MRPTLTILLLAGLALPATASAQLAAPGPATPPPAPAATGVIVRFAPGADVRERGEARAAADVRRTTGLPLARTELVEPAPGVSAATAVRRLEREPDVLYAEPDAPRQASAVVPTDALFGSQWALRNTAQFGGTPGADIDAPDAWEITTGDRSVRVAVIDTGLDLTHPDLAANVWSNPDERPGNGVDDDGDGYVDDVSGWDWVQGDATPTDGHGHGTHVGGIIGAVGNNATGVAGIAWQSSLMALRVLDAQGSGTVADAVRAYAYAARAGARVANLSFGGAESSRAERDALAAASGVLFVAAAGNGGADVDDNDAVPEYPCEYDLPNVVCVAASGTGDALTSYSNFGRTSVDLAAPGDQILSTWPGGGDKYLSGTSMAAPQVTGVAALALSVAPALTVAQLRAVLLGSVDRPPALACRVATSGRLDAAQAVRAAAGVAAGAPAPGVAEPCPAGGPAASAAPAAAAPAAPDPAPAATPAPAPAPAPATVLTGAPRPLGLTLTAPRAIRAATLRGGGLPLHVGCTEACRLTVALTLDARTAGRLGLSARRVSTTTARLTRAGRRTLALRLRAAPGARLRGSGHLTLRVTATDAASRSRSRTQAVALRR